MMVWRWARGRALKWRKAISAAVMASSRVVKMPSWPGEGGVRVEGVVQAQEGVAQPQVVGVGEGEDN